MKSAKTVRLGDVCEIIAGQSPEGSNYTSDSAFTEFHQGAKAFGDKVLMPSGVFTRLETKIAPSGAILMSVRAPVGTLNITDRRICIGRGLAALVPSKSIDRVFLHLYLLSARVSIENAAGAGSVFPSISTKTLASLSIPLPHLSEQKTIVARLDTALARASGIAERFTDIAQSADLSFKATLAETFENAEGKAVQLGDVCEVITGSTPSKAHPEYYGGSIPFFKPSDLVQGANTIGASEYLSETGFAQARPLPANAVLVTCIGATLGKTGIIRRPGACNQQINALLSSKATPEYLFYAICSPQFQANLWSTSNATTLPIVNKSRFEALSIPLPPLSVQRDIVARLGAARARCEGIAEQARCGAAAAENLKKALLKEAFE